MFDCKTIVGPRKIKDVIFKIATSQDNSSKSIPGRCEFQTDISHIWKLWMLTGHKEMRPSLIDTDDNHTTNTELELGMKKTKKGKDYLLE